MRAKVKCWSGLAGGLEAWRVARRDRGETINFAARAEESGEVGAKRGVAGAKVFEEVMAFGQGLFEEGGNDEVVEDLGIVHGMEWVRPLNAEWRGGTDQKPAFFTLTMTIFLLSMTVRRRDYGIASVMRAKTTPTCRGCP